MKTMIYWSALNVVGIKLNLKKEPGSSVPYSTPLGVTSMTHFDRPSVMSDLLCINVYFTLP